MTSNVSFGSMFNPERVSRQSIERLSNPEYNIEGLRNDAERPKDFPILPNESIGRSQVVQKSLGLPKELELSDEDKKTLSKLGFSRYGFYDDNCRDFWVHTKRPTQGRIPNITMGDGKLAGNVSRQDFVKGLLNNDTQAFQIAGTDRLGGNKLVTIVKNNETDTLTMYTCDSKECYPLAIEGGVDITKIASAVIDQLTSVQGVTIWKE